MFRILLTPQAHQDLLEIWIYVAQDSLKAADQFLSIIDGKLNMLARAPRIGRKREELALGLRSFPAGSYIVFYRLGRGTLEIIRILHGSRDVLAIFEEE